MKLKLISIDTTPVRAAGNNFGESVIREYECPCGKGKITDEHDNIPGFRNHDVYIECECCKQTYIIDKSQGVSNWKIVSK